MIQCVPFWTPTHAQRRAKLAPASSSRGSASVLRVLQHAQCAASANKSEEAPIIMSLLRHK